eukprot:GILI01025520.1.p1 GENE.GILI01025520.1~~GILI01025520.1.p1  ORF type:complete len:246 (+),score=29.13 GILI01025520.1:61-798(+)
MRSFISSSASLNSGAVSTRSFRTTQACLQGEKIFTEQYQRESFEHHQAMKKNTTYPGPIRNATPGDTKHYVKGWTTRLSNRERHYWRPVVDDLYIEDNLSLRIRLKDQVWVTNQWETRMHTIDVTVPRTATIAEVIRQVFIENRSPYLCQKPIELLLGDKALQPTDTVEGLGLTDLSALYGVDIATDHIDHLPEAQPKDPHVDEITENDLRDSNQRYRDMGIFLPGGKLPKYQSTPSKMFNFGRF